MAAASLQSHDDIRCILEQAEESLISLNKRIETMEAKQQQQHKKIRAALEDKEKETEAIKERINEMNKKHQKIRKPLKTLKKRLKQMEQKQLEQNHQLRSSLDQQEKHLSLVKESFKQITDLQLQKHTSIRSDLDEEEERLRSSNVNRSTVFQIVMRPVRWVFIISTIYWNGTGNQNPRSALEQKKENLDSLETRIKQIEEIQRQEEHQLTSALQHDEKQSQLQREDIKTADTVSLQKRVQILEDFQKHLNKRSSVKEEKLKLLVKSIDQIKSLFQRQHKEVRAFIEEKETDPLLQRSSCKKNETEDFKQIPEEKDEQHKLRSKLKEQQREIEALQQRITEKDEQLQLTKSAFKEKQTEAEVLLQRVHEMEAQLQKSRSALTQKEDEHKKLNQSFQALNQQQNHNARSLKDKEKETEDLKRTITEKDEQLQSTKSAFKEKQMETEVLLQRSALTQKEDEHKKLNQRVHEMEAQLQKSRSALREKDEQLKSFKDRVAGEVALSIKTGNTMSLNNPVNKNRLKEMYEDLRCDWPRIKKNLKSNNKHPDSVKELILKEFREAKIEMRNRRMMINKVFENVKNAGGTPQRVDQYRQLTVQNLQMTLYNEKQDAGSQKSFLENEAGNPQDVLEYLGSECYWLGCLMALNNPPLQPDWENHPPSMDRWDFFPRNIRNASENE